MKSNNDGVSPIIATVLMIAITVVLAGLLYPTTSSPCLPPMMEIVGAYDDVSAVSSTEGRIVLGDFSEQVPLMDIRIYISSNGTRAGYLNWTDHTEIGWINGPDGASVVSHPHAPTDGLINSIDYIILGGLQPGTEYTIEIVHMPSDSVVSMAGAEPEFRTPGPGQ